MDVPVADIAIPRDPRHGAVASGVVEVSIYIQDELPIRSATVAGAAMKELASKVQSAAVDEIRAAIKGEGWEVDIDPVSLA